jgi:hypothetical protein
MVVGIQWPDSMRSCASLCDKLRNEPLDRVAAIHRQASMWHCGKLPWEIRQQDPWPVEEGYDRKLLIRKGDQTGLTLVLILWAK